MILIIGGLRFIISTHLLISDNENNEIFIKDINTSTTLTNGDP